MGILYIRFQLGNLFGATQVWNIFQVPPAIVWPELHSDALNVWGAGGGFINSTSTLEKGKKDIDT